MKDPEIVFLDTNVYIIGTADPESAEAKILAWLGFLSREARKIEVVVSEELFEQISRVAKRLQNKDWAGEILARIWQKMNLRYVLTDPQEWESLAELGLIPREDVGVYLTARNGKAEYFISSNRELIRELSEKTGEFVCMTPEDFFEKVLKD